MATEFKGYGRIFMQWIFTIKIGGTDGDGVEDDDDGANTSLKRSSCESCALSTKVLYLTWITKSSWHCSLQELADKGGLTIECARDFWVLDLGGPIIHLVNLVKGLGTWWLQLSQILRFGANLMTRGFVQGFIWVLPPAIVDGMMILRYSWE